MVVAARASLTMRCTCALMVASCVNVPFAASENSVSSGIEPHRK